LDPDGNEWTGAFESWAFKEEVAEGERGAITTFAHDFWDGYKQFDARWEYDRQTNAYKRFTGGEAHLDFETQQQITAKNVVVLFTKEILDVDDLKHNLYQTIGEGEMLLFQDGQVTEGYWSKDSRTGRTVFTTKKGEKVAFNPGQIWISVVATDTNVAY
jgi:hypothetical protein